MLLGIMYMCMVYIIYGHGFGWKAPKVIDHFSLVLKMDDTSFMGSIQRT